jgi:hypothetical protein
MNRNLDILSKYISAAIFSSARKISKKIVEFKSTISSLSGHKIRQFVISKCIFFHEELGYVICFFRFYAKIFRTGSESCNLNFSCKKKLDLNNWEIDLLEENQIFI